MFAIIINKFNHVVGQLERVDGIYRGHIQPTPQSLSVPVQLQSIDQQCESKIAIGDGEVYRVVYVTEPLMSLGAEVIV